MEKEQAIKATIKRYTNLVDGKVLPFVSVATIINFYEGLLCDFQPQSKNDCGITKNFEEECINELENEAADYE